MKFQKARFCFLCSCFFLLCSPCLIAQFIAPDTTKGIKRYEKAFGMDAAYEYQKTNGFYLGLNYLKAYSKKDTIEKGVYAHIVGPALGFSINYDGKDVLWGQRLSVNYYRIYHNLFGLNVGVFAENYATQKFAANDFRIGVTGGISASGVLSLNYSYSQPLNNETLTGMHKISLVLNLNFVTLGTGLSRVVRF